MPLLKTPAGRRYDQGIRRLITANGTASATVRFASPFSTTPRVTVVDPEDALGTYSATSITRWGFTITITGETEDTLSDAAMTVLWYAAERYDASAEAVTGYDATYYFEPGNTNSGDGSSSTPWDTFSDGVAYILANHTSGDKVRCYLAGGTYRQTLNTTSLNGLGVELLFYADMNDPPTISGADEYDSGDWSDEGGNQYSATWTGTDWPGMPAYDAENETGTYYYPTNDADGAARSEMLLRANGVFLGERRLRQVLDSGDLDEETFWMDDEDGGNDKVWVELKTGATPAGVSQIYSKIEVTTRAYGIYNTADDVTFRNINITKAGCLMRNQACDNITVERCSFTNSTGGGYFDTPASPDWDELGVLGAVTSSGNTHSYTDCFFINNSIGGLNPNFLAGLVLRRCYFTGNNYRGTWAGGYQWDRAGCKCYATRDVLIEDCHFDDNMTHGLWFDRYCSDVRILDGCTFNGNWMSGLFLETSIGPFTIQDATIANNGRMAAPEYKAWDREGTLESSVRCWEGCKINSTANIYFRNVTFSNNGDRNIYIEDNSRTTRKWEGADLGTLTVVTWGNLKFNNCKFYHSRTGTNRYVRLAPFLRTATYRAEFLDEVLTSVTPSALSSSIEDTINAETSRPEKRS